MTAAAPLIAVSPGSVDDPERDRCFRAIQLALANYKIGTVLAALIDSLGCAISCAATDRANAGQIVGSVGRDLNQAVDLNWETIRSQLAAISEPTPGLAN